MSSVKSPFASLAPVDWPAKTLALVNAYPLASQELVTATLEAWNSIFTSSLGGFQIGADFFPAPQTIGLFLHELIPLVLSWKYPGIWRNGRKKGEKDLVYISDQSFSAEIKTSSHPTKIFGNRSYAQQGSTGKRIKDKSGYYLAINFEPFTYTNGEPDPSIRPSVLRIRFGWIDHADWTGQAAATGQQASLSPVVESGKLLVLYQA